MEIVNKTILRQIITQCAGTQNIIKNLASCDPCGGKSGLKTVAFLFRLSIFNNFSLLDHDCQVPVDKHGSVKVLPHPL